MSDVISAAELSHVLGLVYDAAIDANQWEPALAALKGVFLSENAMLTVVDKKTGNTVFERSHGISAEWIGRYEEYRQQGNQMLVVTPAVMGLPVAFLLRDAPPEYIANVAIYQNWGRPQGLIDTMGITVLNTPGRVAQIGAGRHERIGPYGPREVELADLLLPHLRRAMEIADLVEMNSAKAELMSRSFDKIAAGMIVVDGTGRIIHTNVAADEILAEGDFLKDVDGSLLATAGGAQQALRASIAALSSGDAHVPGAGYGIRLDTRHGDSSVAVAHVLPLTSGERRQNFVGGAAIVFVNKHRTGDLRGHDRLAAAFDLTTAEVRVLGQLMLGQEPLSVSKTLAVSESTVRTHIRALFEKTGTNRLSALVGLAMQVSGPGGG